MSKYLIAVDNAELKNFIFEAENDEEAKEFRFFVDLDEVDCTITLYRLTSIANYPVK